MRNLMNWKIKYGLVLLVVSVVILFISAADAFKFMKDPITVTSISDVKKLKDGDHVNLDITMIADCLISETHTTTDRSTGKVKESKETNRYYLVPFVEFDNELNLDVWYLTVKIKSKDFTKAESAWDAGDAFIDGLYEGEINLPKNTILSIDGIVKDMNKEEKSYTNDYVGYLDLIYVDTPDKKAAFILMAIGFVCLAVGALFIVLFILGKKKENASLAELQATNPNYYQAPSGVTFNNDNNAPAPNPYAFDPSTDPRFNGQALGNPVASNPSAPAPAAPETSDNLNNQSQGFQDPYSNQ